MFPPRRPSAYLLALLVSPLAVLVLVGWTRFELARAPVEVELGAMLGPEALAALAVEHLWTAFDVERGADEASLDDLRGWLDARGVTAGAPVEAPYEGPLHDPLTGPPDRIVVARVDTDTSVELAFALAPTLEHEPGARTPLGTWAVTRRTWAGTGHALLGRDVGCALCHVTVRPVPRVARVVEPVRVGVLGDLVLRSDARVAVHGTLHVAGTLRGPDSDPLAPQTCPQLRFAALGADLRLERGASAPLDPAPLTAMDLVRLRAAEGLMLGRYRGPLRLLRRPLPTLFPGFDDVRPVRRYRATPKAEMLPRAGIWGGRGGVVEHGAGLSDVDAGAGLTPTTHVAGSLWAVGTSAEPLRLDGDVEIEGDLVIGGVARGRGSLRARGTIVVVGSLRVEGHLALVAGQDLLAGAAVDAGGLVQFVRDARQAPLELPAWISAERLTRMGDRARGPLVLEAFCYAPRHVIVVAPRGASRGDVHVRGGLVAEIVAVHAPGELVLEDDPDTRAMVELRAPAGLELRSRPSEARASPRPGR